MKRAFDPRRLSAALTLALLVSLASASSAGAEGLAIVGATVIDGTGAPPLADAVIWIEGERIRAVGPRSQGELPAGAKVLDARGRFVVPGLVDSHVHFFQSGGIYTRPDVIDLRARRPYERELALIRESLSRTFARYLLSGITSVADVGGPFWNFEVRERAAASPMAPRVAVAGPLLSTVARPQLDVGDPPIIKVADRAEAAALARRELERQPDLVKVWFIHRAGEPLEPGEEIVAAAVAESRARGVRVAVHATGLEAARAAVRAGASVLVHSVTDRAVDDAFVSLLKEKKVVYIPTLFVGDGYRLALSGSWTPTAAEKRRGDPEVMATLEEIKTLPEASRPSRPDPGERPERGNLKRLSQAGVLIAVGTDAGNIGTLHGPSIFRELDLMVEAGMTPAQVLVAATQNGARVMGRESDLGTIEAGKLADLLILEKNPLEELAHLQTLDQVVKGGRVFAIEELLRAVSF
jgi:imidazolonepropionase-like amidohydrolase